MKLFSQESQKLRREKEKGELGLEKTRKENPDKILLKIITLLGRPLTAFPNPAVAFCRVNSKCAKMGIMRVSRFTKQVTYIFYGVFRVVLLSLLYSRPTKSLQRWHSAKLFASISYRLYRLLLSLSPSAFRSDWSTLSS